MTEFIIIVAAANNNVIGRAGTIPWHIPSDLAHFKKTTMSHPVLMGRKTFDSIGKPLPGRVNLILTRDPLWEHEGCIRLPSINEALSYCRIYPKVFIIGGGDIFETLLPHSQTIILTQLERDVEGDVYFPEINPSHFREIKRSHHSIEEPYSIIHFARIERKATIA